jgi:DNA-binding response OmpR family regulator
LLVQVTFLPAEAPRYCFPEQSKSAATDGRTGRLRVLVVDDEQLIATTVAAILNSNGFEAVAAFSGDEALAEARRVRPDIVLSDVLMPKMSGVELGMQLRNEFPEARVVLFSGQAATTEMMRKAHEKGYQFDLIAKPIHPEELVARLRGL